MAAEMRERVFSVRVGQEISHIFTIFSFLKNGLVGISTQLSYVNKNMNKIGINQCANGFFGTL